MPDAIMYQEDAYVVLESGQPEQFMESAELFEKLKTVLAAQQDDLPADLRRFEQIEQQARYLLETACEFSISPDHYLQWFVVRLEK